MIVFDLEDGVPIAEKQAARANIAEALALCRAHGVAAAVRVNALGSGHFIDDLLAIAGPDLREVHVPKISGPEDVLAVEAVLLDLERRHGLPEPVAIAPTLESPKAVRLAFQIATASRRVSMLQFGSADYTAALGLGESSGEYEPFALAFARTQVVSAAAEAGIPALDTAYLKFRDLDGFREEALAARALGFEGKSCIHPSQVEIANAVFSPSESEIEKARVVLERLQRGSGETFEINGAFVDAPVVERARRVMERAVRLGPTGAGSEGGSPVG